MTAKPPHGAPCNNCGACCAAHRCPLAAHVFGPGGGCPALELKFPGFTCGLVADPGRYAPAVVRRHGADRAASAAHTLIGGGIGCDAVLAGEPINWSWRAKAMAHLDRKAGNDAAVVWGLR